MTQQAYVCAVRDSYLQLPHASGRFSRSDRQLAADLYQRRIPLETVRAALLLATARRISRDPASVPLPPVRSLHYFLHVIDEITAQPLPQRYIQYLEYKIAEYK
jgi:hypothetical protein